MTILFKIHDIKAKEQANLLTLYTMLFTKLNQEGDGIWSRFNIVIGINLAIFAGAGYIMFTDPFKTIFFVGQLLVILCICGTVINLWSWYVFRQLWWWHTYWYDQLIIIEKKFPSNFPKIITAVPFSLGSEDKRKKFWYPFNFIRPTCKVEHCLSRIKISKPKYTNPFIWLFLLGWLILHSILLCRYCDCQIDSHSIYSISLIISSSISILVSIIFNIADYLD